jgi:arsenite methyltransferase
VITVCDQAAERCPIFPGDPNRIHWSFSNPAAVEGAEVAKLSAFNQTLKQMRRRLHTFIPAARRAAQASLAPSTRSAQALKELPMTKIIGPQEIKRAVVERYGARARKAARGTETVALQVVETGSNACCDDSCCGASPAAEAELSFVKGLYSDTEVEYLPRETLEAAAGCGNPTAIAELKAGEVVLDLGSGAGIDCFLAARQVGPEGRVIGVDMTPAMVSLARANATKIGATNVVFKLGEIEDLPLPDASVDVVISNCVINLSVDKPLVFREAFRVLRPRGRLRVSDMVWLGERPADAAGAESWAGCVAGALPLAEYLDEVRKAGFSGVRQTNPQLDREKNLASALVFAEKP